MNGKIMISSILCFSLIAFAYGAALIKADEPVATPIGTSEPVSDFSPVYLPHFTYSNGDARGSSVHFAVDETTGTISKYTVKFFMPNPAGAIFNYMNPIYDKNDSITESGGGTSSSDWNLTYVNVTEPQSSNWNPTYENVTLFKSVTVNGFVPVAEPRIYADYLVFQGKNTVMLYYDRDSGQIEYASGGNNTTITFEVPEGLTISQFNKDALKNQDLRDMWSPWEQVYIKTNTTTTSLTVTYGTVTVDGQTITVTLGPAGYLDLSSWVEYPMPQITNMYWYNDLNITSENTVIENAKNTGIITAEGWVQLDDSIVNNSGQELVTLPPNANQVRPEADLYSSCYTYNDPSFNMNFTNVSQNAVEVVVDSEIHTGRIVIINVDKSILQNTSIEQLLVKIDSDQISSIDTLQNLMEKVYNKDTNGYYYALSGDHITTIFVYVPHFSTHTISIQSLSSTIGTVTNILVPIVLSILFSIMIIGGVVLQKRKQRDDF